MRRGATLSFSNTSSRSRCSPSVMSSTRTTSISLCRWFTICWMTASDPVVTSVIRETVGSSVGATHSDSML